MAEKIKKDTMARSAGKGSRFISIVLVSLILLGTAFLTSSSILTAAAEYNEPTMSIGIRYGSSACTSFRTYSDKGYELCSQKPDDDRTAVKLGTLSDKTLIVAPSVNLAPSGTGFAAVSSGVTVGGYRLETEAKYASIEEANAVVSTMVPLVKDKGYTVFPAYVNGEYKVRIGCFASLGDAQNVKDTVSVAVSSALSAMQPSENSVCILTSDGKIKFEFDNGTTTYLGLRPAGTGDVYMRTDDNYIYEGLFMYKREGGSLTVINMINLESYVEGVLPYEISSSWHIESQKAFAIAARSYAVGNKGRHYTSYGFDLCNSTNCQVYRGAGSANDAVKRAVAETRGQVLVYNDKPISVYYSSSTGGCTVSAKDCWGGTGAPYFVGVSTPWERYADYGNGEWISEVSPTELCSYLVSKGYTRLSGSIASVEVVERGTNSDYVKTIRFTDTSGVSVEITNSDSVRTALSKYLKSANFVVGQGSVAYTVSKVTASTEVLPYNTFNTSSFNVITSQGKITTGIAQKPTVRTGSGQFILGSASYCVITADSINGNGDAVSKGYKTDYINKTATASSSSNFVFAGKGWGHGVGLSQYGTKDLAEFGYSYDKILKMYVPSAQIKMISELS